MISLPHHLPLVRVGSNCLAVCDDDWLEDKILDAAEGTDLPQWKVEAISKGVYRFLSKSYKGTVIESDELIALIARLLESTGLGHVAARIDNSPPTVRISLSDLARRAGSTHDLAFFQLLEDKCREVLESGASSVICSGMERCIATLRSNRRWNMSDESLQQEIESRIDEFRYMGELNSPVFNVAVAVE